MARQPRIHFDGALYHVICRGNNKEFVFLDDADKRKYVETIRWYKLKYGVKVYCYCIMENHAHLLLQVGQVCLGKVMQGIQQVYTQYYNKKFQRTGHVFEQRYKAILCNNETYLLTLIRYIHQNPMRANLVKGLDYRWSSHLAYCDSCDNSIADPEYALKMFGGASLAEDKKHYLLFMQDDGGDVQEVECGAAEYKAMSDELLQPSNNLPGVSEPRSLEEIKAQILADHGFEWDELKAKCRKCEMVKARNEAVLLLSKHTELSNSEIAELINLSQPMVSIIIAKQNDR